MRCAFGIILLVPIFVFLGCGGNVEKAPETHEFGGKVLDRAGKPLTGGTVEMRPVGKGDYNSFGEIQPDGTFTIYTILNSTKVKGAQPGEHTVTIIPSLKERPDATPIQLKKNVTIKPGDKEITIKLD